MASVLGHDGDGPSKEGLFGEPVWAARADYLQLRGSLPAHGVRVHFVASPGVASPGVASPGGATASAAADFPLAAPVLDAGPGQPAIPRARSTSTSRRAAASDARNAAGASPPLMLTI